MVPPPEKEIRRKGKSGSPAGTTKGTCRPWGGEKEPKDSPKKKTEETMKAEFWMERRTSGLTKNVSKERGRTVARNGVMKHGIAFGGWRRESDKPPRP